MQTEAAKAGSVRERILGAARRCFYERGYRATGINLLIAESGVAKASFYAHFRSKEDLLVTYMEDAAERQMAGLRDGVMGLATPRHRFLGPLYLLPAWLRATDYRGCPFQAIGPEIPPDLVAARAVLERHRENLRAFFEELGRELKEKDGRYGHVDPVAISGVYLLLLEGTMATAAACRQDWPVKTALEALRRLLENPSPPDRPA